MQIVIPLAGYGSRFKRAGYLAPKPLIEVDGLPFIEHVVRCFPGGGPFVFICMNDHLEHTQLGETLRRLVPEATIVGIEGHKLGPVHTVLQGAHAIDDGLPTLVNYCDFSMVWDFEDFEQTVTRLGCAGCVTAYRGFHPHSLGPNLYAMMRERDGFMLEIREKHCFTDDRMNEFASAGGYYFRSGALLKRCFREAVARNWAHGGEFYCSTPYNLLVEEGLPVAIYELEHFLQWGTPEDLEEYQRWSGYFAQFADWKPGQPAVAGTNLIPMAGEGRRFRVEGYDLPKPLVPVCGRTLAGRSLRSLPAARRWIAVCQRQHLRENGFRDLLTATVADLQIVELDGLTAGQAATCLEARGLLDEGEALLIGASDTATVFDERAYAALLQDTSIDALVWTFRDHPHANRHPKQYGWVRTDEEGWVRGISCKIPLSDEVRADPGVIGIFWFRRAADFLRAADALIESNQRTRGEFYVDDVFGLAVAQGLRARVFDVRHFICFGTPNDVRTYQYWEACLRKLEHHPYRGAKPD